MQFKQSLKDKVESFIECNKSINCLDPRKVEI